MSVNIVNLVSDCRRVTSLQQLCVFGVAYVCDSGTSDICSRGLKTLAAALQFTLTEMINETKLHLYRTDVILESPAFTLFEGDVVILRCSHRPPGNEKKATFYRNGSPLEMDTNHQSRRISDTAVGLTIHSVSVSDRHSYKCKFDGGRESEERELQVKGK